MRDYVWRPSRALVKGFWNEIPLLLGIWALADTTLSDITQIRDP
jgi:hypothetical protein